MVQMPVIWSDTTGPEIMEEKTDTLFEILKTGKYKEFLIPDYFPEVIYMESDDKAYMRSTFVVRKDERSTRYWFFTFSDRGKYLGEATSGFIPLDPTYSLLHISGSASRDSELGRNVLVNENVIGAYDLSSTEYSATLVTVPAENEESEPEKKTLYVPRNSTAPAIVKSGMSAFVSALKKGNIYLPVE